MNDFVSWTVGKLTTAAAMDSGIAWRRTVALVIMPKVPSEPTINPVRLYPAEV